MKKITLLFMGGILMVLGYTGNARVNTVEYFPNLRNIYQSILNGWATPSQGHSKEVITPEGCKKITSSRGEILFIPTKTTEEWRSFKNNLPSGISITECPVNATCGSAAFVGKNSYPSSNHCGVGTKIDIDTVAADGTYNWRCNGLHGGSNINCSNPKIGWGEWSEWSACNKSCGGGIQYRTRICIDPTLGCSGNTYENRTCNTGACTIKLGCGSNHNKNLSTRPATNLCNIGYTPSSVSGNGPWNWTCSKGASTESCSAAYVTYYSSTVNPTSAFCGRQTTELGRYDMCTIVNVWDDVEQSTWNLTSSGGVWTITIGDEGCRSVARADVKCVRIMSGSGGATVNGSPCEYNGLNGIQDSNGCCWTGNFGYGNRNWSLTLTDITNSCGASVCASCLNTFAWKTENWSSCSRSCGGGTQSRTVNCVDRNGTIVSNSYCQSTIKPITGQSCNTNICN